MFSSARAILLSIALKNGIKFAPVGNYEINVIRHSALFVLIERSEIREREEDLTELR